VCVLCVCVCVCVEILTSVVGGASVMSSRTASTSSARTDVNVVLASAVTACHHAKVCPSSLVTTHQSTSARPCDSLID